MTKFKLTLLRHGETARPTFLNGSTDIALSERGYQQMSNAIKTDDNFDLITTSPLIRCHKFAQDLASQYQWPVSIEHGLREICFGDWDGQAMDSLYQEYPVELDTFWKTPWQFTPPNGESMVEFTKRVDNARQHILTQHKDTLVICHSGVIRYLMAKTLGMPLPGNHHLVALNIGFAARVDIEVVVEESGKLWQSIQWPSY